MQGGPQYTDALIQIPKRGYLLRARIPSYKPFICKGEEFVWMNGHMSQFFIECSVIRQCPEEGIRILLRKDRMKFPVNGPSFFMIKGQFPLYDKESSNTHEANMISKSWSWKTSSFQASHSLKSTLICTPIFDQDIVRFIAIGQLIGGEETRYPLRPVWSRQPPCAQPFLSGVW
jgi:hypothetical protein